MLDAINRVSTKIPISTNTIQNNNHKNGQIQE